MRKSNRFADLKDKALGLTESEPVEETNARPSVIGKRQATVNAVTSGKVKRVKVIQHDPARIRPWSGHNRDYSALSQERCKDLIDSIQRAGQQFPAIVRTVTDSPDYDFEFICGARRHWTAHFLKLDLVIEVRDMDDRTAFTLQDIENRDREDISDYERAIDYKRALAEYFEGNISHMAGQLQIDRPNFSRYLALAELPTDVVESYADIRELVAHHGTIYHKFLKDPDTGPRVLSAAKKLKANKLPGKEVMAFLKQAAAGEVSRSQKPKPRVKREEGPTLLKGRGGQYTVKFSLPNSASSRDFHKLRSEVLAILDELAPAADTESKGAEKTVQETAELA